MRTRTKKHVSVRKDASQSGAGTVFRLTDMVVEEVSAVDRAANKRTFLVIKSAEGATPLPNEIVKTPTGENTVVKAPGDVVPAPAAPAAPAPAAPTSEPAPAEPSPLTLRLAPEHRTEILARFDAVTEDLAKMRAAVEGAEEVQGLTEVPVELIESIGSMIMKLSEGVTKAAVSKGRKQISVARENKLRGAFTALQEILAELDAPKGDDDEGEPVEPPAAEPAPAELAPAAPVPVAASATTKADASMATLALLTRLVKASEAQTETIRKQGEKIAVLESRRVGSNAGAGEQDPLVTTTKKNGGAGDDVRWPVDMSGDNGEAPV